MSFPPLSRQARQSAFLLFIAGTGGLLYGIDVGIIAGALPYLESVAATQWQLSTQQLGLVVAAVLLGSVLSSLFAGALADAVGRRRAMLASGLLFVLSIPMIAMADGYAGLLMGRLLQGVSGGLIGVVVPLYLAECLDARMRGRGTALFQLLLTIGLVLAAVIGWYYARQVEGVQAAGSAAAVLAAKDQAWRSIFWACLLPGLVFTAGVPLLPESPRWLAQRGRTADAHAALLRTRSEDEAATELAAMTPAADVQTGGAKPATAGHATGSLLQRRYVAPFLLACLILACNQATGINSILAYAVTILGQAGLPGSVANLGDISIKVLNALMTVAAVALVDRKGRKFLLMLGTGGIVLALLGAGLLFRAEEVGQDDLRPALASEAREDALALAVTPAELRRLGAKPAADGAPLMLTVAYAYGDFTNVQTLRSDQPGAVLRLNRAATVTPDGVLGAALRRAHLNPFPDPAAAQQAPLHIERASVGPLPAPAHGYLVLACILAFVASFAVGPGVCVWLALSELMPTRIRSNGMSVALLINQLVSTVIAAVFLPTVGRYGYGPMFLAWAGCTLLYFLTAALLLPETRGKTLEQIEAHFARR